jgi:hypothetical protein
MKIRDTIQHWASLTWGGSYSGMNSLSVNPATSLIKSVEVVKDRFGQKSIRMTVQKADNNVASVNIPLKQVIPSEQTIFEKVAKGLKSAIGKTLNEAGEISI